MKTIFKTTVNLICATFLLGTALVACSTDDDSSQNNDNNNVQEITEANSIATSGNWSVSNYTDDGQNETSDYNGYVFTFDSSGSLIASNGSTEIEGTWSIQNDDNSSDDDDDDSDIDFNIFFAVADDSDFDDLSDDWDIVSITDAVISLRDVSGGDGSVDLLTFVKI